MMRLTIVCVIAAALELAALVSIIEGARAPVVRCYKPWLSTMDERAACAIEAALVQRHAGRQRPKIELRTGWKR